MLTYYPLIGIPCRADTSGIYPGRPVNAQNNAYINAVIQAGGLPILIPLQVQGELLQALFRQVDGLIFSGGGDIDPVYYNEIPQVDNLQQIHRGRDEFELGLMQMALQASKPFLAICRGIQVMNVASGGKLWQDITRQHAQPIRHDYYYDDNPDFPRNYLAHEVKLDQASLLAKILETDQLQVNSLHHQGVKEVPPSLKAAGHAPDGLVEVLEARDHPFGLGVQWHPEELVADQLAARQIFTALIVAARNHRPNG